MHFFSSKSVNLNRTDKCYSKSVIFPYLIKKEFIVVSLDIGNNIAQLAESGEINPLHPASVVLQKLFSH